MASLNHGKIVKALENIVKSSCEDFIWEFLKAYGTSQATIKRLKLGDPQRNVARIDGDVGIPQKLYFRAVNKGCSLADTLQELKELPVIQANKIRFILVTDYESAMAYDHKVDDRTEFEFADFSTNYEFFLPMTGCYEKALEYAEHPADIKACEKMGKLYDSIRSINHYEKDNLHPLNIFLTRLLFCFFAEDTGIFPGTNLMTAALQSNTQADGSDVTEFFEKLFAILDLPKDAVERKAYPASFQNFPYVNGALFRERPQIPQFDAKTRKLLLDCGSMTWSEISPVIFGSMFQAVMDPEARRSLGAHYTSEKNILKVVRPLFLDDLEEEFQKIQALKKGKLKALQEFQHKLGTLGFLDPACGCGNFLIVSYRELRELELRVLLEMKQETKGDTRFLSLDATTFSKVTISQFYGIEIEEFPVDVARVSLWLMEHVMNLKLGETFGMVVPSIPLKYSATIVCANALTTPWEDVVQPEKLNYIFGNPPFGGASMLSNEQKRNIVDIFGNKKLSASLDYVAGWYKISSEYIAGTKISVAFVSTNSICQGEQVSPIWDSLIENECVINFAHRTFKWENESKKNAAVYCVIIGFSQKPIKNKKIFIYDRDFTNCTAYTVEMINPYLVEAKNITIKSRGKPLNAPKRMIYGNKPSDDGNLILTAADVHNLIMDYPETKKFIFQYVGAKDYINSSEIRYCLWLKGIDKNAWSKCIPIVNRVNAVKNFRLKSTALPTRIKADSGELFFFAPHTGEPYLLIPRVSSERRKYIPIGFMPGNIVSSDANLIILNAKLYDFAIITSNIHMAWMKTTCGRLKNDYRYSASVVYNTFPWPIVSENQKKYVEILAENILMTRENYPDLTLADMYDPNKMPDDLRQAHHTLDLAVDALYRKKPFESDEERLQLLFQLYEKLVAQNPNSNTVASDEEEEDA